MLQAIETLKSNDPTTPLPTKTKSRAPKVAKPLTTTDAAAKPADGDGVASLTKTLQEGLKLDDTRCHKVSLRHCKSLTKLRVLFQTSST